jgi:hypothetical protein
LKSRLTVLASVGSTAPFLGLFGTVWRVYLDKVVGPVGEALIMTALGFVVAIPAVLAYNFGVRRNRFVLALLDSFVYDLFSFLATGCSVFGKRRAQRRAGACADEGSGSGVTAYARLQQARRGHANGGGQRGAGSAPARRRTTEYERSRASCRWRRWRGSQWPRQRARRSE